MPEVERAYEKYDGVLIGQVVDVSANKESNQIELKVIKSFKGIKEETLTLQENMFWGSLWGPSEVGQKYLYFLRQTKSGWENPLCSPTKKVIDTTVELTYLQDKEIQLNKVPVTGKPSLDNNTIVDQVSDEVIKDDPPPPQSPTNWKVIILIGTGLLVVLGTGIIRLVMRSK
jgi:hypothetical protein